MLRQVHRERQPNDPIDAIPYHFVIGNGRGMTDGEVYAFFTDQVQPQLLGQFNLVGFSNAKGLEAMGSNLFLESPASGPAIVGTPGLDGLGMLRQNYLEESTVDSVREVTELIKAQRGYELNAKVITAVDQMLSATTQVR